VELGHILTYFSSEVAVTFLGNNSTVKVAEMSSNHQLQGKITGPRADMSDRRIAKTHELTRSTGPDGKLYTKVQEEDEAKYKVLDAEGIQIEERRASQLRRSIQIQSGGSKLAADGMAKSNMVGKASHHTKITMRQAEFAATSGAESKAIETVRKGDLGISISQADAKHAASPESKTRAGAKGTPRSPQSPASPKVRITTKTMTLSPQSKAYERNLEGIAAEMKADEMMMDTGFPAAPAHGDTVDLSMSMRMPPRASSEPNSARGPRAATNPNAASTALAPALRSRESKSQSQHHKVLSKAEAVHLHEEREKLVREEKEKYLKEQQERYHRASIHGREFAAMKRREETSHEKNEAKRAVKLALQQKQQEEEQEARERKRREHLSKEINPASAMSWREIQEAQEIARREAAERRKQELASMSKAPAGGGSGAADAEKRMRDAAKAAEYEAARSFTFKAEDPEKVAEKLAKQNAAWERKLEEERERVRQRMAERILTAAGKPAKSPVAAMEERAATAAVRRAARQAERDERSRAEAAKKAAVEKKKTEKLCNAPIPEEGRKLTKSATNRANMVRAQMEKEEEGKKKEERQKARKAKQEREMSRMLSHQIADSERDRREAMKGGYREISEAELEQNRANAKREYKLKLKENKEKLEKALAVRPSLLQRHEQAIATKQAAANALSKVAKAVSGGTLTRTKKESNASGYEDDYEFFTQEENVKLSVIAA